MQPTKRRRGATTALAAVAETAAVIGLAALAVVQGAAASWGVLAGTIEMFRRLADL